MIPNAVVPVAGIGTRLFPATKSQPKELLPIGRKPVIQHVVEELRAAGIANVLFVTGRRKTAIENHFDHDFELMHTLASSGKQKLIPEVDFERLGMHLFYTRQARQLGLGHAIGCAEAFMDGKAFVVALGDTVVRSRPDRPNVVAKLMDCFEREGAACVIALQEIDPKDAHRYGIARPAGGAGGDVFRLADLVEKPDPASAPSNLAVAARYAFSPDIFPAIARTAPGTGGEIQLTDAIRLMMQEGRKVYGVRMAPGEIRYDIGTYETYYKCFLDFALDDADYGGELRTYLKARLGEG